MANYNTNIVISAQDNASGPLLGVGRSAQSVATQVSAMGRAMQWTGARMAAAVTLPVATAVRRMSDLGLQWSDSTNMLGATLQGTVEEMAALEDQARSLGRETIFDPIDVVNAQTAMAQSGFAAHQILGGLEHGLDLVAGSGMNANEGLRQLTDTVLALGYEMRTAEESGRALQEVADSFSYTAANSNATVPSLLEGSRQAAPLFNMTGAGVQEMAAMQGALGNVGFHGSQAGRGLRNMILRIMAPTARATRAFSDLGVEVDSFITRTESITGEGLANYLAGIGQISQVTADQLMPDISAIMSDSTMGITEQMDAVRSMIVESLNLSPEDGANIAEQISGYMSSTVESLDVMGVMQELAESGATVAQLRDIFGTYYVSQMAAMLSNWDEESGVAALYEALLENSTGYAARRAEQLMANWSGTVRRYRAAFQEMFLSIFEAIEPRLSQIVEAITSVFNRISELPQTTRSLVVWGSIISAALGPILIYSGLLVQSIGALVGIASGLGGILSRASRGVFVFARSLLSVRGALLAGVVAGVVALGQSIAGNIDNTRRFGYAVSAGIRMATSAVDWFFATVSGNEGEAAAALYRMGVQWENFSRIASELASDVGMAILESVVGHEAAQRAAENLGIIWGNLSEVVTGLWEGIGNFASALRHDLSEAVQIFGDDASAAQDGIAGLINWFAQLSESLPDTEQVVAWIDSFAQGFTSVLIPAIETAHAVLQGFLDLLGSVRDGLSSIGTWIGGEGNAFSGWLDGLDSGRMAGAAAAILLLLGPLRRILGAGRAIIRVFASLATPLRIAAGWGGSLIAGLGAIAGAGRAAVTAVSGVAPAIARILGPLGALLGGIQGLREFYNYGSEASNARHDSWMENGNSNMTFAAGQGIAGYRETVPLHAFGDMLALPDDVLLPGYLAPHRPGGAPQPMAPGEAPGDVGGRLINLEGAINELRAAITGGELRTEIDGAANVNINVTDSRVTATASSSGNVSADLNVGSGMDGMMVAP
jgi:hypothetical protein